MNMTKPENYKDMSNRDRHEFVRHWILMNHHNVNITCEKTSVPNVIEVAAFDKKSGDSICAFRDALKDITIFRILADSDFREDFDIKIVGKPGKKAFMIDPIFLDETQDFKMIMSKDNIIPVTIMGAHGADDLDVTINSIDDNGKTYCVVQEAFFYDYEDAVEACSRTPEGGYNTWEEYKEKVKDLVVYTYKVKAGVQLGSNFVIDTEGGIGVELEAEAPNKRNQHTVRAFRTVFELNYNCDVKLDIQVTPWLNYASSSNWVTDSDSHEEVVVHVNDYGAFTDEISGYEVRGLSCSYRTYGTLERIMPEEVVITAKEMRKLKAKIQDKQNQIFDSISKAQADDDENSLRYLENLKMQCAAELRLLYYLEGDNRDIDKFIIC